MIEIILGICIGCCIIKLMNWFSNRGKITPTDDLNEYYIRKYSNYFDQHPHPKDSIDDIKKRFQTK